ncbi:MAG: hypothetical protein Q9212_001240 [Teloschistes hypoglaucus]
MQKRPFSPTNPQQRSGSILPPLSKYYYGPAVSPDRSPVNGNSWNTQEPPALPPRLPPNGATAPPISQWSPYYHTSPQQSKIPGPPPTTPPHPVAQSSYNPNAYGLMPGIRHSPINTTWNQSSQSLAQVDTSAWGVKYNHGAADQSQSSLKPPLPPRAQASQSQPHLPINEDREQFSRETESFEYLRPVAYSPATSPSIPQRSSPSSNDRSEPSSTQPEPQRLAPPPPPKIPPRNESGTDVRSDPHRDAPTLSNGSDNIQDQHIDHNASDSLNSATQQMQDSDATRLGERSNRNDSFQLEHRGNGRPDVLHMDAGAGTNWYSQASNEHASLRTAAPAEWPPNFANPRDEAVETFALKNAENAGRSMKYEGSAESSNQQRSGQILASASTEQEISSGHGGAQAAGNTHDQVQRDDSFYWHSPHSSASMSRERVQDQDIPSTSSLLDASPKPQDQHPYKLPDDREFGNRGEQPTSLYQSTVGPYSASALGFGGPSDWEHFGDYDGEEVDDTDLYIRSSSPDKRKALEASSELPGDPPVERGLPAQEPTTVVEPIDASTNVEHEVSGSTPLSDAGTIRDDEAIREQTQEQKVQDSTEPVPSEISTFPTTDHRLPPLAKQEQLREYDVPQVPPQIGSEHAQPEPIPNQNPAAEANTKDTNMSTAPKNEPHLTDKSDVHEGRIHTGDSIDHLDGFPLQDGSPRATETILSSDILDEPFVEQSTSKPNDAQTVVPNESQFDEIAITSDVHDFSRDGSIKRASLVSDRSLLSKTREMSDAYADLDPWARASLNRYIAMLREEAQAISDTEKLNLFKAFSRKEWKLRAILYGADDEQEEILSMKGNEGPVRGPNTLSLRRPPSKALPALPPDAHRSASEVDHNTSLATSVLHKPSLAQLMVSTEEDKASRSARDKTRVTVDTPGGRRQELSEDENSEIYSPGGRPVRTQPIVPRKSVPWSVPYSSLTQNDKAPATPSKEQISVEKPAYTPFRYSQGYPEESEQPVDRRASFRPYAALKLEPVEDRAKSVPESISESPTRSNPPSDTQDPRLGESAVMSGQRPTEPKTQRPPVPDHTGPPPELRRFERADFDPLISVLPGSGEVRQSAVELSNLRYGIDSVPDDFSFIHQHVVAWDAKAKQRRAENEKERQIRQGESEQRIDALFNDDEIGYGDISELESEFKRAEAARKTDEDRAEYQTFVTEVFDVVWTRLHFEIDQLSPLYEEYTSLAHETVAGKDMFEATAEQFALAPTMSALLTLHQKLEIRHQKAFEAVLERDRKLKKTEVSPWYTLANIAKVKQLEKQFDQAEKKAIVDYCKQRDRRANRLMDVLDQNTLRGVGTNQDYMEAVMKAVRRIASGRAFASTPSSEQGIGMNEVVKAKAVTAMLASSSEQIVQTFHVADMLLNAAEYELSVATARLANAESSRFERLQEERASEDAKLMRDLQHRLALIREDSRRTNDEIVKLLCFLGVQGGHAQVGSVPNGSTDAEAEHQQRLHKALEDAKRRNAQKAAGDGIP